MTTIIATTMMSGIIATSRDWAKNLWKPGSLLMANSLTQRKAINTITATNPSAIPKPATEAVTLAVTLLVVIMVVIIFL